MKAGLAIALFVFGLAGCATRQVGDLPANNPLEQQCRTEGKASGAELRSCVHQKASLGIARDSCARKGLSSGSPAGQTCIKLSAQYTQATVECQAEGQSTDNVPAFQACIAGKAPAAAAYNDRGR